MMGDLIVEEGSDESSLVNLAPFLPPRQEPWAGSENGVGTFRSRTHLDRASISASEPPSKEKRMRGLSRLALAALASRSPVLRFFGNEICSDGMEEEARCFLGPCFHVESPVYITGY